MNDNFISLLRIGEQDLKKFGKNVGTITVEIENEDERFDLKGYGKQIIEIYLSRDISISQLEFHLLTIFLTYSFPKVELEVLSGDEDIIGFSLINRSLSECKLLLMTFRDYFYKEFGTFFYLMPMLSWLI